MPSWSGESLSDSITPSSTRLPITCTGSVCVDASCLLGYRVHPVTQQLVVKVLWEELLLRPRRLGQQRQTSGGCLWTVCEFLHTHTHTQGLGPPEEGIKQAE